jgi:hypothetical protein
MTFQAENHRRLTGYSTPVGQAGVTGGSFSAEKIEMNK